MSPLTDHQTVTEKTSGARRRVRKSIKTVIRGLEIQTGFLQAGNRQKLKQKPRGEKKRELFRCTEEPGLTEK